MAEWEWPRPPGDISACGGDMMLRAAQFDALGGFGLVAVVLFLVNLTVAYAYEWRRGGLDWD